MDVRIITINFILGASVGAIIWALSPVLTGFKEPWDSTSHYYLFALVIGGVLLGSVTKKHSGAYGFGAFFGQLIYMVVFVGVGAFFVLGAALLVVWSSVLGFAAIVSSFFASRLIGGRNPQDIK